MNWKVAGIVALIAVTLAAMHFFSVTLPELRAPLPHPPGYAATGAGAKSCAQVRWDWAVMERGGDPNRGLDDNLWVDQFALAHGVTSDPTRFYDKLNDWCDEHPRNTLADAAYYTATGK